MMSDSTAPARTQTPAKAVTATTPKTSRLVMVSTPYWPMPGKLKMRSVNVAPTNIVATLNAK